MKVVFNDLEKKQYEHLKGVVANLNKAFKEKFIFTLSYRRYGNKIIYTLRDYIVNADYGGYKIYRLLVSSHRMEYEKLILAIQRNINEYITLIEGVKERNKENGTYERAR